MQSLLDQMVDLFDPIEELVEFYEAANNPIPVGEVVNISYLEAMINTRITCPQ